MKKHGPRINRRGEEVSGFWFAKAVARRRRRNAIAKQSRKRNRR